MVVPHRRALLLLAPFGLVALVGACSSDRGSDVGLPADGAPTTISAPPAEVVDAPDIESIVMIGDSITRGSESALRDSFDELGVEVLAVDGADGRRLTVEGFVSSGLQAVDIVDAAADPDLWVVALGTNDIALYATDDEYRAAIDDVLDGLPDDDAPLVWVDVYVDEQQSRSKDFNDTLAGALDERGNATIVEWSTLAGEEGMLTDGVHPGEVGVEVFADLVAGGVGRWL